MTSKIIEVGYGKVNRVRIGGGGKLVLIGGPCAIENRDHAFMMAERIGKICEERHEGNFEYHEWFSCYHPFTRSTIT